MRVIDVHFGCWHNDTLEHDSYTALAQIGCSDPIVIRSGHGIHGGLIHIFSALRELLEHEPQFTFRLGLDTRALGHMPPSMLVPPSGTSSGRAQVDGPRSVYAAATARTGQGRWSEVRLAHDSFSRGERGLSCLKCDDSLLQAIGLGSLHSSDAARAQSE